MVWEKRNAVPRQYEKGLVAFALMLLPNASFLTGCRHVPRNPIVPPPPIAFSCVANPLTLYPGDPLTVTAAPTNLDPTKPTRYSWKSSGGVIRGQHGPTIAIDTQNLAPGSYTVTGTVAIGQRSGESSNCSTSFAVRTFEPATISCSANPSFTNPGDSVTINASAVSPQNRPLAYSYSSTAGRIIGSGPTATLSTVGAPPGYVTVTCNVVDDKGLTATAVTTVSVAAPAPPPRPASSVECVATPNRARPGDPVTLEISPASPEGAVPYIVRWHPSAGVLDAGTDRNVIDTTGVARGTVTVSAEVMQAGQERNCSTSFVVDPKAPVTPWPYLNIVRIERKPRKPEAAGYGVYTYLIYRQRPSKNEKDNYARFRSILAAIAQFGAPESVGQPSEERPPTVPPIKPTAVDKPISRRELAPIVVPVDGDVNFTVDELAEHYNAQLAGQLAGNLDCQQVLDEKNCIRLFAGNGPYLISTNVRITARPKGFLMQNLDRTEPEVAGSWISAYMNMVSHENSWSGGYTLETARLDFFKELNAAGGNLTNSKVAVMAAIKWFSFKSDK